MKKIVLIFYSLLLLSFSFEIIFRRIFLEADPTQISRTAIYLLSLAGIAMALMILYRVAKEARETKKEKS